MFLDYDGTLADFAPTPDHIEASPEVVNLLKRLVPVPTIRVTIISGRRLRDLRTLLPVAGIFLAGTYGIEMQTTDGEIVSRIQLEEVRPILEEIKPQWQYIIEGRSGFFLEDKGWALALHARFASDSEAGQVLDTARQVAEREVPEEYFRILGGHKFLEIAPMLTSKRETVAYLLKLYPLQDSRIVYIGDDDKDEEAFTVIRSAGGIAIKVFQPSQASLRTTADYWFDSPADTLNWLKALL